MNGCMAFRWRRTVGYGRAREQPTAMEVELMSLEVELEEVQPFEVLLTEAEEKGWTPG